MQRLGHIDDARLYFGRDLAAPELVAIADGEAAVFSSHAPGWAGSNEDAAALIPLGGDAAFFAVADGVGGAPAGEQASRVAIEAVWSRLSEARSAESPTPGLMLEAIEAAQQAVRALGLGAATTLAALEVRGARVRPYHVGDSRVLVIGQRGRIKLQTVCHSPVGFAVEAGVLNERAAMHHVDRHLVSNVLGAADTRIEVGSQLVLSRFDTALLGSDGLFDNLFVHEIAEALCSGALRSGVEALVAMALRRMQGAAGRGPSKPDDLTVVAFRRAAPRAPGPNETRRKARSSP